MNHDPLTPDSLSPLTRKAKGDLFPSPRLELWRDQDKTPRGQLQSAVDLSRLSLAVAFNPYDTTVDDIVLEIARLCSAITVLVKCVDRYFEKVPSRGWWQKKQQIQLTSSITVIVARVVELEEVSPAVVLAVRHHFRLVIERVEDFLAAKPWWRFW